MLLPTRLALLLGVLPALSSCDHSLQVIYPKDHKFNPTFAAPRRVAVLPYDGDEEHEVFFQHVLRGLKDHPSVREMRTEWHPGRDGEDFRPDLLLRIRPQASYSGSGWNFLVTFPGFLVFAPAWHGLVYHGRVATELELLDPRGATSLATETVTTDYEMRHLDFGRAFWAESGWWLPGYGATSVFSALYNITYDDDATQPFQENLRRPYGEYIAERIMKPALALLGAPRGKEVAGLE